MPGGPVPTEEEPLKLMSTCCDGPVVGKRIHNVGDRARHTLTV